MRTSELVQRLQAARQSLQLPQALAKLERYERRSILITANQPFSGWNNVFPDPGMTVAAIDRLVHHSTIFELSNVESYRSKEAARQQKVQRENDRTSRRRQSSNDNAKRRPRCLTLSMRLPRQRCSPPQGTGRDLERLRGEK